MKTLITVGLIILMTSTGCGTVKKIFAVDDKPERMPPIHNPFAGYEPEGKNKPESIVLRTKKGDRSVEVELPGKNSDMTDFVVPVSPAFRDQKSQRYTYGANDDDMDRPMPKAGATDREIARSLPSGALSENEGQRREIETGLGLMPTEDAVPDEDKSYLGSMDQIKRLYKNARYEAALVEIDDLLRAYPTDSKLYEMRGTLLDRVGRQDLAMKSWTQALKLDPANAVLRKFVERKSVKRGVAGQ